MIDCVGVTMAIELPESITRKVNLASAQVYLSNTEWIGAALTAALVTQAQHSPELRLLFAYLDDQVCDIAA